MFKKATVLAMVVALAGTVGAEIVFDTILDPLSPSGDRANLTAPAGQTFLTGTLGGSNQLSTVEIQAPDSSANGTTTYIAIYADADGDTSTWGLGNLLAVSTDAHALSATNEVVTWNFSAGVLSNNTAYVLTFTSDPAGTTQQTFRVGMESNSNSGSGGGIGHTDGHVFDSGSIPFSDNYDIAATVTLVAQNPFVPVILTFDASSTAVESNDTVTLSWSVLRADALSLEPGIGDVTGLTSTNVVITEDIIYSLIASNAVGIVTNTVEILINPPVFLDPYALYRSDMGIILDGSGNISTWETQTVTGHDLDRVTSNPSTITLARSEGGTATVVDLDGNSGLWVALADFGTLSSDRTVVARVRLKGSNDGFLFDGTTSASGLTRAQVRGGMWQVGVQAGSGFANADPSTTAITSQVWQTHIFQYDENGGNTEVTHWVDGSQVGNHTVSEDVTLKGIIIGVNGSQSMGLEAELAEIQVYDKLLTPAERLQVEADLTSRWGTLLDPVFDTHISQFSDTVPRFGEHGLLQIGMIGPESNITTLDEVTVSLKGGSWDHVSEVALYNGGIGSAYTELGSVTSPSSNVITFTVNVPLERGNNNLFLAVVPERYAPLDSTIDALVNELVFSGTNAGAVVPADGDPAGELTIGYGIFSTDVRVRGGHGLGANYRIPGIACDSNGVLHAVYDNRYGFGGDLPGDVDVAYNRSTDGGVTWEPQQVIMDYDSSVPGSSGNGVGDPCILYDPVTDTIWVAALWSFGNNGYNGSGPGIDPEDTGQYVLTKSTDGGDTWSEPINITADIKDPAWNLLYQGPGHGLAMRDGTLVFPSQVRDGTTANDGINQVRACSVYSTDHGVTWQFGSIVSTVDPQQNENTVCELDDGRLLFSCRMPNNDLSGQRGWVHYTPGGAEPLQDGTWSALYGVSAVPDPVCQGSVIQWKSTTTGHPKEWILFANPATGGRNGMTLRVSLDGGLTWPISRLVYAGPSAYSALCILPDETIGLLYEKDGYGSINFVRVDEGWLLDPDADFDEDGMSDSWETLWGTDPGVVDDAEDPDEDGVSNIDEMKAGTDPQDAGSMFWVSDFSPGATSVQLTWASIPGKAYAVSQSEDLVTWTPVGVAVVATGPQTALELPIDTDVAKMFYRSVVIP